MSHDDDLTYSPDLTRQLAEARQEVERLTDLKAALKAAVERAEKSEAACVAYRHWLVSESGWKNFREEYDIENTASGKNAKLLRDWLDSHGLDDAGHEWLGRLRAAERERDELRTRLATAAEVRRGPTTLGEGRYEVYRKVSGVRSGEGPYVLSADAIALRRPDEKAKGDA